VCVPTTILTIVDTRLNEGTNLLSLSWRKHAK